MSLVSRPAGTFLNIYAKFRWVLLQNLNLTKQNFLMKCFRYLFFSKFSQHDIFVCILFNIHESLRYVRRPSVLSCKPKRARWRWIQILRAACVEQFSWIFLALICMQRTANILNNIFVQVNTCITTLLSYNIWHWLRSGTWLRRSALSVNCMY